MFSMSVWRTVIFHKYCVGKVLILINIRTPSLEKMVIMPILREIKMIILSAFLTPEASGTRREAEA